MSKLFLPAVFGELSLLNRIIMAPMTRCRAGPGRVPSEMNAEYYGQRASAGLIVTEATSVNPMGVGYANTPGIWSEEQVEGWKKVTKKVHDLGGKIMLQLWHVGRASDPIYLKGKLPVAPSAIAIREDVLLLSPKRPYCTPRAFETEEILKTIEDYKKGAENAQKAGFDGVEIHSANGYLADQFLQSSTNLRTDEYGGSVENRTRFSLAITDAAISVWGPGRVGLHVAPRGDFHDMGDASPKETFGYLAQELRKRKIAFLSSREYIKQGSLGPYLKEKFGGNFIANEMIDKKTAETLVESGQADAVSFGRLFLANPDLVTRFQLNAPLNKKNKETFYSSGPEGYTDYPTLS